MIKLLFSLGCVLLCTACGAALSNELSQRRSILETLLKDIRSIRGWIAFERIPLYALFQRLDESSLSQLWSLAAKRAEENEDGFAEAWSLLIKREKNELLSPLSEEETEILLEIGERLSSISQLDGQMKQIDMTLERLTLCAREAKDEMLKKSRLLQSLGAMGGLALVIVLW